MSLINKLSLASCSPEVHFYIVNSNVQQNPEHSMSTFQEEVKGVLQLKIASVSFMMSSKVKKEDKEDDII